MVDHGRILPRHRIDTVVGEVLFDSYNGLDSQKNSRGYDDKFISSLVRTMAMPTSEVTGLEVSWEDEGEEERTEQEQPDREDNGHERYSAYQERGYEKAQIIWHKRQ